MPSSGPIVRTGATPEFWKNWEQAFGAKKSQGAGKTGAAKKSTKKTAAPKAVKKTGGKAATKKKK